MPRSASAAASAGGRARMGGPANDFERVLQLLGPRLDEIRSLVDDLGSRWRGDAVRVGEGTKRRVQDLARELGLVTRDEWDELELRVAQLEHRLRLVEDPPEPRRP
jgi:hypothetical protein